MEVLGSAVLGNSVAGGKTGLLDFIDRCLSHKHFFSGSDSGNERTANVGMLHCFLLSSGRLGVQAGSADLLLREQVGEVLLEVLVGVVCVHFGFVVWLFCFSLLD